MKRLLIITNLMNMLLGYNVNDSLPYVITNSSFLGDGQKIYFAIDNIEFIRIDEDKIINISSKEISAYTNEKMVFFKPFDNAYVNELDNSSMTYNKVIINDLVVVENHLDNLSIFSQYKTILICIGSGILFLIGIQSISRKRGYIRW